MLPVPLPFPPLGMAEDSRVAELGVWSSLVQCGLLRSAVQLRADIVRGCVTANASTPLGSLAPECSGIEMLWCSPGGFCREMVQSPFGFLLVFRGRLVTLS